MSHYLKTTIAFLSLIIFSQITHAGPWFTGPILAPAGHTIPRGHTNFELYGLDSFTTGQYDSTGKVIHVPEFKSVVLNPLMTHGFADWMDIQISVPYAFNNFQGISYRRLTDSSLGAGFQIFEQKKSKWLPDFRFVVQEVFPTGAFEQLNPAFLGTDATGLGSYRTLISLNFQYLSELFDSHYLRTRFILSHLFSSSVNVTGLNSFGGTLHTQATVNPGSENNVDLAFEYTVTQNWVAVLEGYYSQGRSNRFDGILDIINGGTPELISRHYDEYGFAPALEYNFNGNIGIIGGVLFPVAGKNTADYTTYVLAINAYW